VLKTIGGDWLWLFLFGSGLFFVCHRFNPYWHCHRPIIVRDGQTPLGQVIPRLKVNPKHSEDDVIDEDIILLWGDQGKVITGSDILGRLLRGIVQNEAVAIKKTQLPPKFDKK